MSVHPPILSEDIKETASALRKTTIPSHVQTYSLFRFSDSDERWQRLKLGCAFRERAKTFRDFV